MANQPGVRLEGVKEVRKQLKDFNDKVGKDMLKDAHKQLADRVVSAAMPQVPVGATGRLAGSVHGAGTFTAAVGKAGSGIQASTGQAAGQKVPYAAAIHWGVGARPGQRGPHNIKARPFLIDALNRVEPDAAEEFAEQLRRLIARLKGLS